MTHPAPVEVKPFKVNAKGRLAPGEMNGLESKYAAHLETLRAAGEIAWWKFGAIGLSLAQRTWYRPDFLVMLPDGSLEVHETKGFMRDDANVKLKVAAAMFPLVFRLVKVRAKKHGGGWEIETIGGGEG